MNFFRTPFFIPWIFPRLTWRIPAREKSIYLTFDDGPIPGPTEFVIDTLNQAGAKATFFCIGDNVQKHPSIYGRLSAQGYTLGNHTFHHLNGWKNTTEAYCKDVKSCGDLLGPDARLFRPPYGLITRSQILALSDYRIIMWDVLTYDFSKSISPEKCLQAAVRATRPGSIIVFHDSLKAEKNLTYALPRFIEHFGSQGYTFKSIAS